MPHRCQSVKLACRVVSPSPECGGAAAHTEEEASKRATVKKMNEWLPNELSVNPGKLLLLSLDGIAMRLWVLTIFRVP